MAHPDPEIEGRLLALRKAVAQVMTTLSPDGAAEMISAALLHVGEEDPGVMTDDPDPVSAAMAQELAAVLAQADRLRRGYD
ncbi:MAG: hypothetical protein CFE34_13905 [Rhodobacteraceae bacterium PARR1]|nr:MAG: hypothetical protein CFE34_13905 [Rhodobacteraceae bacterium PARR1]